MSTQETEPDVSSTFNNDHISVSVTKLPHCHVKFDIQVKPSGTEAAYQKAIKTINKEVVIPGFRKGRAPDQMILEKFHGPIQKEFVDTVLQTAFNDAIHLTHVHPLKDGQIKRPVIQECTREKGAQFTLEFETRPHVPSVNFEDLKLPKVKPPLVTDNERENAFEQVLLQFTTYEPIEDRPVEEHDFVDLSVDIMEGTPRNVIDNQRTQVDSKGLPSWMRAKVLGLNTGEAAEGMTDQDPNLSEPDPNFRSVPFRVTVNGIWKGVKPAADDELAKRVGLTTIDELHTKINERLEHEVEEDAHKLQIQALEQLLIEKYPFDIPQSYIDANSQSRLHAHLQYLKEQGIRSNEKELSEAKKTINQSTIRNLQLFFLYQKVAMENDIQLTDEEVSQELARQFALISSGRSSLDLSVTRDELREQVQHLAMDRKIKQFLLDHATFD